MSSSQSNPHSLHETRDPDTEYDIIESEYELSDTDNGSQFVREGLLRQEDQCQPPRQNPYIKAMNNLINLIKKVESAPAKGDDQDPARKSLSFGFFTKISPELAAAFGMEIGRYAKSAEKRATKNVKALEALLDRVPDGQPSLADHIATIVSDEQYIKKGLKRMLDLSQQLEKGELDVPRGSWSKFKKVE